MKRNKKKGKKPKQLCSSLLALFTPLAEVSKETAGSGRAGAFKQTAPGCQPVIAAI